MYSFLISNNILLFCLILILILVSIMYIYIYCYCYSAIRKKKNKTYFYAALMTDDLAFKILFSTPLYLTYYHGPQQWQQDCGLRSAEKESLSAPTPAPPRPMCTATISGLLKF